MAPQTASSPQGPRLFPGPLQPQRPCCWAVYAPRWGFEFLRGRAYPQHHIPRSSVPFCMPACAPSMTQGFYAAELPLWARGGRNGPRDAGGSPFHAAGHHSNTPMNVYVAWHTGVCVHTRKNQYVQPMPYVGNCVGICLMYTYEVKYW